MIFKSNWFALIINWGGKYKQIHECSNDLISLKKYKKEIDQYHKKIHMRGVKVSIKRITENLTN